MRPLPIALLILLAACAAPAPEGAGRAGMVVAPVVAETVPGAPGAVLARCIMAHATPQDLAVIAADAGGEARPETVALISEILARPETVACAMEGLA